MLSEACHVLMHGLYKEKEGIACDCKRTPTFGVESCVIVGRRDRSCKLTYVRKTVEP